MQQFPGLMTAYIGPNAAHRQFRTALANAKALGYVLAQNDSSILRDFQIQVEQSRSKSPDGRFAFGIAGGGTKNTIQLGILITNNEADIIAAQPGGFISQALALIYREVNRAFETFLIDLFEEIALQDTKVLRFSNKTITHKELMRADSLDEIHRFAIDQHRRDLSESGFAGIEKFFKELGLPILPGLPSSAEQADVRRRLLLCSALRNVIEHNRSIVDQKFVERVSDSPYTIGQKVEITTRELGEALAAVEWTADKLNRRAVNKFELN